MRGDSTLLDALIKGRMVPSPWVSNRRPGVPVRLIVLHTTQGALDNKALGSWFQHPKAKVSSHVGIDDRGVVRFVREDRTAWTAGNANPHATQAELCGYAEWSDSKWKGDKAALIENAAQWVAAVATYYDIPLVRVKGSETGSKSGVCMHVDCTKYYGGTHTDCGVAFDRIVLQYLINRAQQILNGQDLKTELDELESLMAKMTDATIPSPIAYDAAKKVSLQDLIVSSTKDSREAIDLLRPFVRDMRNHLALPGDKDTDGKPLPEGGRFYQTLRASLVAPTSSKPA